MIQHGRPSVTPVQARLHKSAPNSFRKKNKSPLSQMLSCLAPKQRGRSSVRPLPHRALVRQPRRALPPIASRTARPRFPCCSPAFQSPAPLAPSSSVRRPSTSGAPCTELAMAFRAHVPGRLMSSLAEPRVPAHRCSPSIPTPTTGIDRPRPSPLLVANVCFKCFRCFRGILQLLHMDLAKVDQDVAHIAYFCKCFQWYVTSVLKKMFHLFSDVCCSNCFI
jgi:hypothetical protein